VRQLRVACDLVVEVLAITAIASTTFSMLRSINEIVVKANEPLNCILRSVVSARVKQILLVYCMCNLLSNKITYYLVISGHWSPHLINVKKVQWQFTKRLLIPGLYPQLSQNTPGFVSGDITPLSAHRECSMLLTAVFISRTSVKTFKPNQAGSRAGKNLGFLEKVFRFFRF